MTRTSGFESVFLDLRRKNPAGVDDDDNFQRGLHIK